MGNKMQKFDCVEMMHRGALRIYEETKGMSVEEELAYWQRRDKPVSKRRPGTRKPARSRSAVS